ncbi:MAG: DUF262 domain-containing protein, partial [Minicystis sp.]
MRPSAVSSSETQIRYLGHLLAEIDRGQILLPRFLRPLVWPKELRLDLLDSVLQGIPIGAITLWRTHSSRVAVMDRFGPFTLPSPDRSAPVQQYVLDGEQRLATLYSALIGASQSAPDGEPTEAFQVFYDLRARRFVTRDDLRSVSPYHLPLTDLFQSARLIRFQRRLSAEDVGGSPGETEELIGLSDDVSRGFREYQLPTLSVVTDDLGLVTHTFERMNTRHVALSEVHLVNALTWSSRFDLLDRLQQMKEGPLAELGWQEVDDQVILRICKVTLNIGAYEDSAVLSVALQKNQHVLDDVERYLCAVARFLKKYCGIRVPDLVPYTAQIIFLAGAFRHVAQVDESAERLLRDWFWFTTYTEMFSGQMSASRFFQLLEDVRKLAGGQMLEPLHGKPPTQRRLMRFDFRTPRSRGLALLLVKKKPCDPLHPTREVRLAHGSRLLAEYRTRGMVQIVTSPMAGKPAISGSPGARVLIRPESIGAMRKLLQSAEAPPDEFLQSHVISREAWRAFFEGDYTTFVKLREDELNRIEAERFQGILHRLYPAL